MDTDTDSSSVPPPVRRSRLRFAAMMMVGVIAAAVTGLAGYWVEAPAVGWTCAAACYVVWVWVGSSRPTTSQTQTT